MTDVALGYRYVFATVWWLIGQLTVRHPTTRVRQEVNPFRGERLILESPRQYSARGELIFDQYGVVATASPGEELSWQHLLSIEESNLVRRVVERAWGQTVFSRPTSPSPAALSYRMIASLMDTSIHDPEILHARALSSKSSGVERWSPSDLSALPSLAEWVVTEAESEIAAGHQPGAASGWILFKGVRPVAGFDEGGGFHVAGEAWRRDLAQLFVDSGCQWRQSEAMVRLALAHQL